MKWNRQLWKKVAAAALALAFIGGPVQAFQVRVLVEGPQPAVNIAVSVPTVFQMDNGQTQPLQPQEWYRMDQSQVGTIQVPEGGYILAGDRWYAGSVRLETLPKGVAAINYLDSEEYLRGVVPREMPARWHQNALMAQAVAARTYALTSFTRRKWGPQYDLVDTVMDQVYGGFARYNPRTGQSNTLVDPRTDQAVASTKGVVLDSSNGIVQGNYRADGIRGWMSYGDYRLPIRKGAMMSQKVSQQMAEAGWDYAQILTYWYEAALLQLPDQQPTRPASY
jgi:stage II sporulation protein D